MIGTPRENPAGNHRGNSEATAHHTDLAEGIQVTSQERVCVTIRERASVEIEFRATVAHS